MTDAVSGGRRSRGRPPVDGPPGFRWLYTRGYDLAAPAEFAFRWMAEHSPFPRAGELDRVPAVPEPTERVERRVYPGRGIEKVTQWEIIPPDQVSFHDEVFQGGRLVVQGEERYRFFGQGNTGSIVEVTAFRKPVGWTSRLGFALFPERSVRTHKQEAVLFDQIEREYRRRPNATCP